MVDYLLVNDIHLSDRAPSSCVDSYNDDLFDLLAEINRIAAQRQAAGIIYAGDIFDKKTPSRTSHATVLRLIQTARDAPCPVWAVVGNHDLSHDRLDSLSEGQPLGVVFASGAILELNGWMDVVDAPIFGLPWLGSWDDDTVDTALRPYTGDAGPSLVVTHAPLYPPGRELPYEFYAAAKFADAVGGHGTVHYGHVHEPHGTYAVNGVTFSNCGALSRGSLHEHNLARPVQIASWDSNTGCIQHLVVAHKPADQVFRLAEVGQARTAQHRLEDFLTSIGSTRIQITSIEAVRNHIDGLDLDRELVNLIDELLAGAA